MLVLLVTTLGACGSEAPSPSALPRTTTSDIVITMFAAEETLPIAGCHSYWFTQFDAEPPPGSCEETQTVMTFEARLGDAVVVASVQGGNEIDPVFVMRLESMIEDEGITIAVVLPPSKAVEVRLIDAAGDVLDQATPAGGAVALAGLGSGVAVEAISSGGDTIAECGPDRVIIDGIAYDCTPTEPIPVTSTITVIAAGNN